MPERPKDRRLERSNLGVAYTTARVDGVADGGSDKGGEAPFVSVKTSATFERSQSGQDTLGEAIETSDIVISRKNRIRLSNEDKKRYTQKRSKAQYENKKSKEVKTTLEPTPRVADVSTASKGKTLIPEPVFKVVKQPIKLTF